MILIVEIKLVELYSMTLLNNVAIISILIEVLSPPFEFDFRVCLLCMLLCNYWFGWHFFVFHGSWVYELIVQVWPIIISSNKRKELRIWVVSGEGCGLYHPWRRTCVAAISIDIGMFLNSSWAICQLLTTEFIMK